MFRSTVAGACSRASGLGYLFLCIFAEQLLPGDLCTSAHANPKLQKYVTKIKQKPGRRLSYLNRTPSFFRLYKQMQSPVRLQSIIPGEFWWTSFALSLTQTTLSGPPGLCSVSLPCLPTKWWVCVEEKNSLLVSFFFHVFSNRLGGQLWNVCWGPINSFPWVVSALPQLDYFWNWDSQKQWPLKWGKYDLSNLWGRGNAAVKRHIGASDAEWMLWLWLWASHLTSVSLLCIMGTTIPTLSYWDWIS